MIGLLHGLLEDIVRPINMLIVFFFFVCVSLRNGLCTSMFVGGRVNELLNSGNKQPGSLLLVLCVNHSIRMFVMLPTHLGPPHPSRSCSGRRPQELSILALDSRGRRVVCVASGFAMGNVSNIGAWLPLKDNPGSGSTGCPLNRAPRVFVSS